MSVHNRTRRKARRAEPKTPNAPGTKAAEVQAKYPEPPKYADDNAPQPKQPACYDDPARAKRPLTDTERAIQGRLRFPQVRRGRG